MTEHIERAKKHTSSLLDLLGFDDAGLIAKTREDVIYINIQTDSPALLIGRGGEGLEALQHLIRTLLSVENQGEFRTVVVDIEGYREKKAEFVKKLARDKAFQVLATGMEEDLEPMSSFERRIVHMVCSNIADVETESVGEGRDRKVKIKPKKA